jgi:hypothetical protein
MTVETALQAALAPLASTFPDFAPFGTARPFICYEQVGGEALSFIDGSLPDKKHGRFQIGVYADTRAQCAAIALQVESVLSANTTFQAVAVHAPISSYQSELKIYGSTQDFSIFSTR